MNSLILYALTVEILFLLIIVGFLSWWFKVKGEEDTLEFRTILLIYISSLTWVGMVVSFLLFSRLVSIVG